MGSAVASGVDRARIAAEKAVASPLLEGIELSGARGVLVNITASGSMALNEYREVMATIRQYTAAEATVICGAVFDESMEDALRVTVVATGLGGMAASARKPEMAVIQGLRNGTDGRSMPVYEPSNLDSVMGTRRTNPQIDAMAGAGIEKSDTPAVLRNRDYDIPAFLKRQSD